MRWQGQRIDDTDETALPGFENRSGFLRSVTTPEFDGMTFHEVLAKSALNHVPGPSKMPFSWTINPYRGCSHACVYCVDPRTLILCADGTQRRLSDLSVGDEIIGTRIEGSYRRYTRTRIKAKWHTRKKAYRVTLADGTELEASGDHRFLTDRGWKNVADAERGQRPHLTLGNRLLGFGIGGLREAVATEHAIDDDRDYRLGYLSGMIHGDGMIFHGVYPGERRTRRINLFRLALKDEEALERTRRYLEAESVPTRTRPFSVATPTRAAMTAIHSGAVAQVARIEEIIRFPESPSRTWRIGYLAGIFDAEGSCSRGVLRISNTDPRLLEMVCSSLRCLELPHVLEPPRPNGVRSVRLTGGLPTRMAFFAETRPAITRKLSVEGLAVKTAADLRVVSIDPLPGERDLVDITTGTGDFIANGVISHNCFARGTHTYLDLDAGRDFDTQIVVKVNVAEVLERELRRGSWQHETVALGTNTDPYQRAEGRYRLMPGILRTLAECGTPFSVLTKGTLIRRDIPELVRASADVPVDVQMSIAMFDEGLRRAIEPGAPTTQARLDTVRALSDAGFRVGVFLMPIMPHLTDSVAAIDDALRRIAAAGADHVIHGALHLRPGVKPWFFQWLSQHRPDLLSSYRALYPGVAAEAPKAYRQWLAKRVRPLVRVHGLTAQHSDDRPRRRSFAEPPRHDASATTPPKPATPAAPMLF